jgi:hypothetical protein
MSLRAFVALVLLGVACSSPPKPEARAPARIGDSIPERSAALRAATGPDPEASDDRWGLEAAAERKRQRRDAELASASSRVIPLPPMDGGARYDAGSADSQLPVNTH